MIATATGLAANDRRIRKLSLTVRDRSHVRRAASQVEEAFRLASLPGESEGRHYHFRFLNLGTIRRRDSVMALTLVLQREFLRLMSEAVHFEDPRAHESPAIYFQSPLEPLRFALGLLARGLPLDSWFLRSAFRGLSPALTSAEAVQYLLELSADLSGGPVATAQLLNELLSRGELEPLLPLLRPEIAMSLMAGFSSAPVASEQVPPVRIADAWISVIRKAEQLWGEQDVRTLWLASCAMLAEVPARLCDLRLPAKAQAVVAYIVSMSSRGMAEGEERDEPGPALPSPQPHEKRAPGRELHSRQVPRREPMTVAPVAPEKADDAPVSRYAGFYFLLHVVERLGISEFLRDHSALLDVNFPWIVLRTLAGHIGIEDDDPLLNFASPIAGEGLQNRFAVKLPSQWSGVFPPEFLDRPFELSASSLARLWVVAVHRWLRRYGRLRMAEVAGRLGQVRYVRPQLDITLLLHQVDLRIRRLGLDIDPGWVAWLGLIVRFHYERALGGSYGVDSN